MKKIYSITLFLLIAAAAIAQKPVAGDMGLTFGINGLSIINATSNFENMGTLLYRYYWKDDMAFRGRIDLSVNSDKFDFSDTLSSEHDKTSNYAFNLNVGLQKSCGLKMKRIEPYITGELAFGLAKSGITDNTTEFGSAFSSRKEVRPGATVSFGLLSHVGANYFFTDHLALGVEFGYGLDFSSTGDGTTTETNTSEGQPPVITVTTTGTDKSFSIGGTGGEALIMFSVFFGKGAAATK